MSSQLRITTSRANGAKSRGPSTAQGKRKSSGNSLRHGLRAQSIVLSHESPEDFQKLLDDYVSQFDPKGPVEFDLVQTMAIARWRLNRILTIEADLFQLDLDEGAADFEEDHPELVPASHLTIVFGRLANHKCLPLILRYEGSLNRSFNDALRQLRQLQSTPPMRPNEPKSAARPKSQPVKTATPTKNSTASRKRRTKKDRPSSEAKPDLSSPDPSKTPPSKADMRIGAGFQAASS